MIQSILADYWPATNTKPRRVRVKTTGGTGLTVAIQPDESFLEAAKRATEKLCRKLKWTGTLQAAPRNAKGGLVFVFVDSRDQVYITSYGMFTHEELMAGYRS